MPAFEDWRARAPAPLARKAAPRGRRRRRRLRIAGVAVDHVGDHAVVRGVANTEVRLGKIDPTSADEVAGTDQVIAGKTQRHAVLLCPGARLGSAGSVTAVTSSP